MMKQFRIKIIEKNNGDKSYEVEKLNIDFVAKGILVFLASIIVCSLAYMIDFLLKKDTIFLWVSIVAMCFVMLYCLVKEGLYKFFSHAYDIKEARYIIDSQIDAINRIEKRKNDQKIKSIKYEKYP